LDQRREHVDPGRFTGTGGIVGNVLTVQTVTSGTLPVGATIAGAGIPAGIKVTGQLTGSPLGGVGTYTLSYADLNIAPGTALTGSYGILTVTVAPTVGSFSVGQRIAGAGVVANTAVTQLGTGTGGNGTYIVDNPTVVASAALTGGTAVETKWFATSAGAPGGLVKMSSWPQG
jgi:hypothetical protein